VTLTGTLAIAAVKAIHRGDVDQPVVPARDGTAMEP
jgi:hypothetical protein